MFFKNSRNFPFFFWKRIWFSKFVIQFHSYFTIQNFLYTQVYVRPTVNKYSKTMFLPNTNFGHYNILRSIHKSIFISHQMTFNVGRVLNKNACFYLQYLSFIFYLILHWEKLQWLCKKHLCSLNCILTRKQQ